MEEKQKIKNNQLFKIFRYYGKYKKLCVAEVLLLIFVAAAGALIPIFTANYLASLSDNSIDTAIWCTVWFVGISVLMYVLDYLSGLSYSKIALRVERDLKDDCARAITATQMSTCDKTNSGVFIERLSSDVSRSSDALLDCFNVIIEIVANVTFFVYVAILNIWMFLVLVGYVVVSYILDSKKEKVWWRDMQRTKKLREESAGAYNEQVRSIRDIKCLNIRENAADIANQKCQAVIDSAYSARKKRRGFILAKNLALILVNAGFFVMAALFLKYDIASLSTILIVYSYSNRAFGFARYLASIKEYITQGNISAGRVFDIIENFPKEEFGDTELTKTKGHLEFNNVHFAYTEDNPVLQGVSIDFKPNEMTAIVGRSGCGKSTILSLANKLYDIKDGNGTITLDGINIKELTEDSLRDSIATVTQTPYVYNVTLRENMKLVDPNVTDRKIIEVFKKAQFYDFYKTLPNKLDTKLGENGTILSGGQKQRFAIARILLKNSPIIVLDEATSALDNDNQKKIVDVIETLKKNHTIIVVAHRLSTILDADNIVVIDQGKVVATGKHEQLMKKCKLYRDLYKQEENFAK